MRTILFAGGGTLGPVTPLLTVAKQLRRADANWKFVWAGTDEGPERELITSEGIDFITIPTAKLPRHLSWKLVTLPIDYLRAVRTAKRILDTCHPKLVLSAGGFTAVPVVREAAGRYIPCITHQLDHDPSLSNRLMAGHCRYVTTSYAYDRAPFGTDVVTYQVPTPTRFSLDDLPTREACCSYFGFNPGNPVLLVTGGGTGAIQLNKGIEKIEKKLPSNLQIIHLMGRGKQYQILTERAGYVSYDFLTDQMITALGAADLVVSRAGFGAISEFAALKKATILIPLPDSPQEANARSILDGTVVVDSKAEGWERLLLQEIQRLLVDKEERNRLGDQIHRLIPTDQGEALANLALSVMK
ncbi:hypothetical protein GF380_03940 [Candidatus Uhrbacteria bacterium]|nr:hypothetical protein [Candidatus Uhrbacteria bacterium]